MFACVLCVPCFKNVFVTFVRGDCVMVYGLCVCFVCLIVGWFVVVCVCVCCLSVFAFLYVVYCGVLYGVCVSCACTCVPLCFL